MLTLLDGVGWDGVPVPGERSHELLACLVRASPRAVGVEELVAQLWPDDEPAHPDKALQVLVSRTRSRTGADAVARVGAGYRLGLRVDQVDALRLDELVREAREARSAGDLDVTRHAARDALAVALTTPEGDGPLGELSRTARRRQDDARRLLGSALLARGESQEALELLERSLQRWPDDEDLVAEVLRAEAAARGVPSALARYAAYVERTLDASGAEPGERLRGLHAELLARDAPVREGLRYDATPLVGRDDDVARLRGLLTEHRVVSVVGPGGLGKTRIAHLLGRLAAQPVVFFVELAGVTTDDAVVRKVAVDLGVRDTVDARAAQSRGTDLRARLAQRVAAAPTLLVLDNCEHVLDGVADLVAFLVATTDRVQVLTTSRSPLGIAAEQVYSLGQLDAEESVELFCARARAARPGVHLAPEEVRALVTRLDGLPLAVELAAAKVKAMSVGEIARRLGDRFALLTGGDRSAPDRHRTLQAVIDWSWWLLRAEDQGALARLSVFPDGFSMQGAEALLGRDPVPTLGELADQSLVVVGEDGGGTVRYRFLETVREYAAHQLDSGGERPAVEAALRVWAVAGARDLARRLFTTEQPQVMAQVRTEEGNLAAVMRTAIDERDVATMVPLAGLLSEFWSVAGEHLLVMGLSRPVLDVLEVTLDEVDSDPVEDAELRAVLSLMALNEALFTGGIRPTSLSRLRELGPGPGGRASAMSVLMLTMYGETGGPDLDALERLTGDPDRDVAIGALHWLSHAQENAGDVVAARHTLERALSLCDDRDGPWLRAQMESMLSGLVVQDADWQAGVAYASSSLRVMEELGALQDVLQLEVFIGLADVAEGRLAEAGDRLRRIAGRPGSDETPGWSAGSLGLAELALAEGDVETALASYRDSVRTTAARRVGELDIDHETTPWVLFAESSALYVHTLHARTEPVGDLAATLRAKLPRIMSGEGRGVDYPVTGCVLLALGAYDLVTGGDADRAVHALAMARRFGYQRTLPSMSWAGVEDLAHRHAPGLLGAALAAYDDRPPAQLRQEAAGLVS